MEGDLQVRQHLYAHWVGLVLEEDWTADHLVLVHKVDRAGSKATKGESAL